MKSEEEEDAGEEVFAREEAGWFGLVVEVAAEALGDEIGL